MRRASASAAASAALRALSWRGFGSSLQLTRKYGQAKVKTLDTSPFLVPCSSRFVIVALVTKLRRRPRHFLTLILTHSTH